MMLLPRSCHPKQIIRSDLKIVSGPAAPKNGPRCRHVIYALFQQGVCNVHSNNLAQRQPSLHCNATDGLELNNLRQSTFKGDRTLADTRHADQPGRNRCQARQSEFIYFMSH